MMARTRNFAEIIRRKLAASPELSEAVEQETFNADIAAKIYEARTEAKLSQRQLAELADTRQPVIARLEDADYDGHSLTMLRRIAKALNKRLRVEFYSTVDVPDHAASRNWCLSPIDWSADAATENWQPEIEFEHRRQKPSTIG